MVRWVCVPGYEGLYEVSDEGNVRSLRRATTSGRILKLIRSRGYCFVTLSRNGHERSQAVHVLVLAAFIGPRPDGMDIRHLDGNGENNRLDNLAYGTRSENMQDALRHRTHKNASLTHCRRGHEFSEANTYCYGGSRFCRACARIRYAERKQRDS